MQRSDHERQAAQFLTWNQKRGAPWEESFALWSESKRLAPADHEAIRCIVVAELLARGDVSSIGLEYLPECAA